MFLRLFSVLILALTLDLTISRGAVADEIRFRYVSGRADFYESSAHRIRGGGATAELYIAREHFPQVKDAIGPVNFQVLQERAKNGSVFDVWNMLPFVGNKIGNVGDPKYTAPTLPRVGEHRDAHTLFDKLCGFVQLRDKPDYDACESHHKRVRNGKVVPEIQAIFLMMNSSAAPVEERIRREAPQQYDCPTPGSGWNAKDTLLGLTRNTMFNGISHNGEDTEGNKGTPLGAPYRGLVVFWGYKESADRDRSVSHKGRRIILAHQFPDKSNGGKRIAAFSSMDHASTYVSNLKLYQRMERGQSVMFMGESGANSVHVHFGVVPSASGMWAYHRSDRAEAENPLGVKFHKPTGNKDAEGDPDRTRLYVNPTLLFGTYPDGSRRPPQDELPHHFTSVVPCKPIATQ